MQIVIKDGIAYKNIIFHSYTFREIIKGCIVKYGKKLEIEAEQLINASDLFRVSTYPPRDYNDIALLLEHEHPYHIAMLVAFGPGYWWKDGPNISAIIPKDYNEWEQNLIKEKGLKELYVEDIDDNAEK